jgi:hypothetical protein
MAYHAYRIYPTATPTVTLRQIVCRDSEIAGQLAAGEAYEPVDFGQSAPEEPTPPEYATAEQGARADTALQPGDLTRQTVQIVTATLAPGASVFGTVLLGKSFHLLQLTASTDCWFRLYSSQAALLADSGRPITSDPEPGRGVLCDLYPAGTVLTIPLSPPIWGGSLETPPSPDIPYLLTHKGTVPTVLTLTLTHLTLER